MQPTKQDFTPLLSILVLSITVTLVALLNGAHSKRICGPNQFRCKNGRRCISALQVCDGVSNCKNSVDEDRNFCSGNYTGLTKTIVTSCQAGMFRCRFGGCINATRMCDGHPDCYDGSDETNDLCRKNRCSTKQFRCDYGACIRTRHSCNGRPDCLDGSDETRDLCQDRVCPKDHFRCNYGACIPKAKVCDKRNHCFDHSDEWDQECNPDKAQIQTTPPTTTTTSKPKKQKQKKV